MLQYHPNQPKVGGNNKKAQNTIKKKSRKRNILEENSTDRDGTAFGNVSPSKP